MVRRWVHKRVRCYDVDTDVETIWYTQYDLAKELGVAVSTIGRAIRSAKLVGGRYRISYVDGD